MCALATVTNADSDMDVREGKRIYTQCTGCHSPDYNRTGPKHCGILGRAAGGVKNFEYTKAMSNSGIIWTSATLNQFLLSPFNTVPGTSMGFSGIASERERQQLIAYLSQLDERNALCN
ncbi:MAG: c-type cytochrome [Gammaproteobacteria bacterium]|nr:c-type cytochrome [Gammaproteobacteria bacterium]